MNLLQRYGDAKFPSLSYATVRDYCDSADQLKSLCTMNDLKDVQRPWAVKAMIGLMNPGGALLEIGAGEPLVAGVLQSLGWQVTVCDPYDGSGNGPREFERFSKAYPRLEFVRKAFDPTVAEPLRGRVDAIYSISVLEHVQGADLEKLFAGIEIALAPGGISLHCADAVVQGAGAEFHLEQMARILQLQNRLCGVNQEWESCRRSIGELFSAAMDDVEAFFLGPQGHNLWRGSLAYGKFPFRRCISVQFISRKKVN
jgi:hypothetical protein